MLASTAEMDKAKPGSKILSSSGHVVSFLHCLDNTLGQLPTSGISAIITGDFNVHSTERLGSTKTTPAGEATEELRTVHGLTQLVSQPMSGDNLLDLFITDMPVDTVQTSVCDPVGSPDLATLPS